jgi:uroporphyrinogen III methyltransferase / synthase
LIPLHASERARFTRSVVTAGGKVLTSGVLSGATVVVTRAAAKAELLSGPLEAYGARVLMYAATRVIPRDIEGLQRAARMLARYDWVIFTSATGVQLTFEATDAAGVSVSDWAHTHVAAVGSATASAIRERGVSPVLIPAHFHADALLSAFAARSDIGGATMLYPAASGARPELIDGLRALGATVDRIDAYDSVATDDDVAVVRGALKRGDVDLVTFTATSAVDAWVAAMDPVHTMADAVSIGPITTRAARAVGMNVAAEAMPSTLDGLVAATVQAFLARPTR